jgi:hypothetical protein
LKPLADNAALTSRVHAILFFYGLVCFVVISDPRDPDVADPLVAEPKEDAPKLWTPDENR